MGIPVVFRGNGQHLFGWYHAPPSDPIPGCAVVLCNPIGYEAVCSHRTYRTLAERLAGAGFATLRFDYLGTGDSAGDAQEPARVDAWLSSIRAAIDEVTKRSGARTTVLFGLRLGATLAATAAAERGDVEGLVLWAPCPSGKAYVREMRVVRKASNSPQANGNEEETAGFLLSKETLLELSRLDLQSLRKAPTRRALIVARAGLGGSDERLGASFEALGTQTKLAAWDGYSGMMLDPHESTVPEALIEGVVSWLREQPWDPAPAPSPRATHTPETSVLSAGVAGGETVLERPLEFGPSGRLFGILSGPKPGNGPPGEVGAILTSVGAMHRIGPGRFYVSLARALAQSGVPTLRFDLSGLGDSGANPAAAENTLYLPSAADDVKAAMDHLEAQHGIRRFLLVGLCSGAYAAYTAARRDPRTAGLVVVNMPSFEWRLGDPIGAASARTVKSTSFYGRAVRDPETWKRILRGEVRVRAIASVLAERTRGLVLSRTTGLLSLVREDWGWSEPARAMRALCARGAKVLLVYAHEDPGLDQAELHLGKLLAKDSRLRLEIVHGADHTFASQRAQAKLTELLMEYVRRLPA